MPLNRACSALLLLLLLQSFARADAVDDYVRAEMKKRRIPALALAVVREGKVVKEEAYGLANVELNIPAGRETVFSIASVTKVFTATAVMSLVEQGKFAPGDRVRKLLPALPATWNGVTVRHLLTHTSGLPDVALGEDTDAMIAETRPEALRKLARMPLLFRPGQKWSYNQTNYVLLAMIIEKFSGESYEEFMARRFFRPLGMNSTVFGDWREVVANRASAYTRYARQGDEEVSPDKLWNHQYRFPAYTYNGAGLNTTAGDLSRWDIALTEGRILKQQTLEEMWTAVRLNNGRPFRFGDSTLGYGAGWMVNDAPGHRIVGHSGGDASAYFRLRDDNLSVIVLTNCQGADPDSLAESIADLYVSRRD